MSSLGGEEIHFSVPNATLLEREFRQKSYAVNGLDQDIKYDLYLQANSTIISHNYTLGM